MDTIYHVPTGLESPCRDSMDAVRRENITPLFVIPEAIIKLLFLEEANQATD